MAVVENARSISLKLVVDIEKNKVIFAETDGHFVDILFSFLTMPLGTIVRLLKKRQESLEIGSLTSLFTGMASLGNDNVWTTEACKHMLTCPTNSSEILCKKLKLNIDDTETKYFRPSCWPHSHLSIIQDDRCICGYKLSKEVCVRYFGNHGKGVFLNPETVFIIKDDLQVFPASGNFNEILEHIGDTNKKLHTKTINIGVEEVLTILKLSLLTDSPLTHAFLSDQSLSLLRDNLTVSSKTFQHLRNEKEAASDFRDIKVKLVSNKGSNKVLYAEAAEDFVNLLFSFMTFPLGAVEHLYAGHSSLPSIDNLYKSVQELDVDKFVGSGNVKSLLLSPKIANKYGAENQLLDIDEMDVTPYLRACRTQKKGGAHDIYLTFTDIVDNKYYTERCTIVDPKSPEGSIKSQGGYVKGPARFMVSDDLKVTLVSSCETFSLIRNMSHLGINDVEERVISIGKSEALSILKASLVSKSALTIGLMSNLKEVEVVDEQKSWMNEDFAFEIVNALSGSAL